MYSYCSALSKTTVNYLQCAALPNTASTSRWQLVERPVTEYPGEHQFVLPGWCWSHCDSRWTPNPKPHPMLNTSEIVWSQICVNTLLHHGMELVLLLLTHWSKRRWWNAGRFYCCYLSKTRRGEEDINWTSHRWLRAHQSMNWLKGKITGKQQIWW